MDNLNLHRKTEGIIFTSRHTPDSKGKLITIENTAPPQNTSSNPSTARFTCAALDPLGNHLVLTDQHGGVFLMDFMHNRFNHVTKLGMGCTALNFSLAKKNELLVGLVDNSLRCVNIETGRQLAVMKGHAANISSISVDKEGRFALTTAPDSALMWDLHTFQRRRKLSVKEDVGILQVFFLPTSNTIVSCFRDDSIFLWDADTLTCKFHFASADYPDPGYRTFAVSSDGRHVAAGGRSRYLHLWNLESRQLQQVLELPSSVKSVRQVHFLAPIKLSDANAGGQEAIVAVVTSERRMLLLQLSNCKLLFELGTGLEGDPPIHSMASSPHGDFLGLINSDGLLQIHSLRAVCMELNKPPPPVMKVWSEKPDKKVPRVTKKKPEGAKAIEQDPNSMTLLDRKKLRAILKEYGQFPTKYRPFIWRTVLEFPENFVTFASLVDKGTHPAYEMLQEKYPIKSLKLSRVLQRTLSALAHWSPIFGEVDYLPLLAFPFVKLFQNNQVYAFEMVATVLMNWCSHWFEYFPNPPINILSIVENVLAHHDRELYEHYVERSVTTEIYAWPLLETVFSEVLTREEWMCLWDTVICQHPGFLLLCVAAYSLCARGPLLRVREVDEFEYFFHHRNAITVQEVVKQAHLLNSHTPKEIHPCKLLPDFTPLTKPQYPVVHRYPKFIVDYQVRERDRIRQEEKEYLKQREAALELQKKTEMHTAQEENWYRQQELLITAEEKRRRLIAEEEERLREQRKRLSALNRELKVKELTLLDAARKKFRDYHSKQRQVELKRLEDELMRKSRQRTEETETAIEDAETRGTELEFQKRMIESELFRHDRADTAAIPLLVEDAFRRRDVTRPIDKRDLEKCVFPTRSAVHGDKECIDDEFFSRVFNKVEEHKERTVGDREVEKMDDKNQKLEGEIEDLLQKLRSARAEISGNAEAASAYSPVPSSFTEYTEETTEADIY